MENLGLHLLHTRERLDGFADGVRFLPYELGYVHHAMDEILDLAVPPEHRGVHRAPITLLKCAVGPADIILLYGHGVWGAGLARPVEGGAQTRDTGGSRVVGVVGEGLKNAAAEEILAPGH